MGCRVHICGRGAIAVTKAVQELKDQGLNVTGSRADITIKEDRESLLDFLSNNYDGKLDILVNNVGTNIRKKTVEYTADEYSRLMSTNVESSYLLTQLCHPLLKESTNASIIFNSSVAGLTSLSTGSIYGLSKGALNQLTKNLACEFAKDGIRVNAVAPWYINTPLAQQVLSDDNYKGQVVARTPLGRVGEPEEVGSVVAFLCLGAASYVTGAIVPIDGGFSCNGFLAI